jgi:hypothetical protein
MWFSLTKYINQEFDIKKELISFLAIKKEVIKKHDKDVGIPKWILVIGVSGLPSPVMIKCDTKEIALNLKKEIKGVQSC